MFVALEDFKTSTPENNKIFPSPFAYPASCKALAEWKKSTQYKVIDVNVPRDWAMEMLDDFSKTVREWLRASFPKLRVSHPAAFDADITEFRPDDDKLIEAKQKVSELALSVSELSEALAESAEEKGAENQGETKLLMKAKDELILLEVATKLSKSMAYFLHYVVSKKVMDRVRRQATLRNLSSGALSTWSELVNSVIWEHREVSNLPKVARMLTQVRKEQLHEWVTIVVVRAKHLLHTFM